jgi:hypothetical protein
VISSFQVSDQNFVNISHFSIRATRPAHIIFRDLIIVIISDEAYKLWSSSLSLLGPNIFTNSLFSKTSQSTNKCEFLKEVTEHTQETWTLQWYVLRSVKSVAEERENPPGGGRNAVFARYPTRTVRVLKETMPEGKVYVIATSAEMHYPVRYLLWQVREGRRRKWKS